MRGPAAFPGLIEHLKEHGWEVDSSAAGLPETRAEIRATSGELTVVVDARLSVQSQKALGLPPKWKKGNTSCYARVEGTWWRLTGKEALREYAVHRDLEAVAVRRQELPYREHEGL